MEVDLARRNEGESGVEEFELSHHQTQTNKQILKPRISLDL